jgi:CHRD domain-containing protein
MVKRILTIGTLLTTLGSPVLASANELFTARLTGDQEAPPTGPVVTDTTGRFDILVSKDETAAEYTLRVDDGLRLQQAHLHCGAVGVNGPIIVFLAGNHTPGWDVDGKWVDNATVTDANVVDATCGATLAQIFAQARLGNVYVNVHSVSNPGGLIRGQLLPAGK